MARQKGNLPRHNSEAGAPSAARWICRRLMLDSTEIQVDLAAGAVKHQEVSLALIFQQRRYFGQISSRDSSVSLESSVAHRDNIPGYKSIVNNTRVNYF